MRKPKAWGHPCPHSECTHYGKLNQGNIRAISTYITSSGKQGRLILGKLVVDCHPA